MGISNKPQQVHISEPIPFCLGPLRDTHCFLLSSFAPTHLLQDFSENYHAGISFSWKGEMMLEFDGNCQNGQLGESHGFSISFICTVFHRTVAALRALINYPYWTNCHLLCGKNLQLIVGKSNLIFKLILQNLFPELTSILQIKRPFKVQNLNKRWPNSLFIALVFVTLRFYLWESQRDKDGGLSRTPEQ